MGARDASPDLRPRDTRDRDHRPPQMAIERSAAEPPPPPPPPPVPAAAPVRVITLEHGDHLDSTLYRFEKGCRLQFRPGPSLLGRKVFLYTNYLGVDDNDGDDADLMCEQYRALEWRREEWPAGDGDGDPLAPAGDAGDAGDAGAEPRLVPLGPGALVADEDLSAEITLTRAGPFHYYFVYETACAGEKEPDGGPSGAPQRAGGSGWWQVEPTLPLPLDALCCQTVLTKCLGPLARWEAVLRVAHEAGYNAVHFTPVQELGGSGSSYSIANQLRLDPRYGASLADLRNLLDKLRHQWNMVFICDVVLNHTANETPWLAAHPEATYNARDWPHLRPAALLDAALARLSAEVARGELAGAGLPAAVTRLDQLEACRAELSRRAAALRLEECFQCDAAALQAQFEARARAALPAPAPGQVPPGPAPPGRALRLLPDPQRRRLHATVDMALALRLYNVRGDADGPEEARLAAACAALRRELDALNAEAAAAVADHLRAAVDNCIAGINYFRLQSDGPKIAEVSEKNPLIQPYFTWPAGWLALPPAALEARLLADGAPVMAHNGWVMAADPLHDFAAPDAGGRVYLRRELIAWGDSVKLRYGASAGDSPFLWAHMREYVEGVAELFDGVRLDNCHSTPPHVAAALLRAARRVRPDLYVVAELFTDADRVDNIYVNRLGITALVREALSAWDAHELGRQVHRFGGRPVGAFLAPARGRQPAGPRVAPALLMDLTHDNPALVARHCVFDALPAAALVAASAGAAGSTRGYDDLVPHQVDVVSEERQYAAWAPERPPPLLGARRALNALHARLAADGYQEIFVDQMDADTVAVTRHHPVTRHSVIVVALTAFRAPAADARHTPPPLRFDGDLRALLLEAHLQHRQGDLRAPGEFARHPQYVNGLEEYECVLRERVPPDQSSAVASVARDGDLTVVRFRPLRPGTVLVLEAAPRALQAAALHALHALAPALRAGRDALGLRPALRDLDLADLGALLYRCDAEERDATAGAGGVYDVPGHGPLVYAGLQGAASLLAELRPTDDLGHPLCANLRAGTWLGEYLAARAEREPALRAWAARARAALQPLAALPHHLRPAYFELVLAALHAEAARAAAARLARWCGDGALARALALVSLQLALRVPSAPLPPLAAGPARAPSLSAGLPHFATGHMRCWGRDTFVSLRGLLLLTGRAADARAHILGFAGCLRHGLIPNLLDGGARARYNCRDAVWWWLLAIKQYCTEVSGGHALLGEPVARLFPRDDSEPGSAPATQPLHDVMQEALQAHFEGRQFRERRAGPEIDAHMTERGFHVQVGVHPDTGFVFGGNDANCGTWMDKMGSSERAGNRGRPATPRDGSAVELVALCYGVVAWLAAEHRRRRYPHAGVTRAADGGTVAWSWHEWAERIHRNFERHFWVPAEPGAADARPDLVHRRAIYKDSHGASQPWADYQLRPNYAVAMAVAPELFDARHAWAALDQVERHLLGPLGLKTLDPADWAYRPDYDNADDSTDPSVAHGFNYHQGPEWTWPLGFYLRARLLFAQAAGLHAQTVGRVLRALGPLAAELRASPWRGLPELTNGAGRACAHSCRSQAWSAAAVLEVLHELRAARRATPL